MKKNNAEKRKDILKEIKSMKMPDEIKELLKKLLDAKEKYETKGKSNRCGFILTIISPKSIFGGNYLSLDGIQVLGLCMHLKNESEEMKKHVMKGLEDCEN